MPYLTYTEGTVNLTQGSRQVTGNKTYWLQKIAPNSIFKILDVDIATGEVLADFYIVEKVISDTILLLTEQYRGVNANQHKYFIERKPEQYLNTEITTQQLHILDKITRLDSDMDTTKEYMEAAMTSANAAKQYAAEAENSMNIAIEKAEIATEKAEIATEKAEIATEKAEIATEKAEVSTEQAEIAVETVTGLLNNYNKPDGVVVVGKDGKILVDLIPAAVQDIKSYQTKEEFPLIGEIGYIYLDISEQKCYLWSTEPANQYVPVDTQVALSGNGSAQTAARSDHNHDDRYEPIHDDYIWNGTIDSPVDLETTMLKDGYYLVGQDEQNKSYVNIEIDIQDTLETIPLFILDLKSVIKESDTQIEILQKQVGYSYIYLYGTCQVMRYCTKIIDKTTNQIEIQPELWLLGVGFTDNALKLDNKQFKFLTKEEYEQESYIWQDVYFIQETAKDSPTFAVRSVNGILPDGAGDISVPELRNKTILANPDDYPLYRNANNIQEDGQQVMVSIALYGTVENYPITENVNTIFLRCYIADTIKFQDCYVLTNDGIVELWQRFGTTNAWQVWSKISGSGNRSNNNIKQVSLTGAKANETKVIAIPKNNDFIGQPIEVLKFVARTGISIVIGSEMKLNNSDSFEVSDAIEFDNNAAILNNNFVIDIITTEDNENLVDISLLDKFEDWRIDKIF